MKIQRNTDANPGGGANPNPGGEGTPPTGTPPAGDPPAGDPPSGDPPAGDPPAGDPPAGAPPAAEPTPAPITDEVLFAEIGKRGYNIKSKEDLDRIASVNLDEYVKVAGSKNAEFAKMAAKWEGDPGVLLKISKMDIPNMDNKSALIEELMIKEGMDRDLAEIAFEKKYGSAFMASDEEGYNEKEKKLAEHQLNKDAGAAKEYLNQWKVAEQEKGTSKGNPNADQEQKNRFQTHLSSVAKAAEELANVTVGLKYELPDKTMEEGPVNYAMTAEMKKEVAEILGSNPFNGDLQKKLVSELSKGEDGEESYENFVKNFMEFKNRKAIYHEIAKSASSKGLANHLKNVKPGTIGNEKRDAEKGAAPAETQSTVDAYNEAYKKRNQL